MKFKLSFVVFIAVLISGMRIQGANTPTPRKVVISAKRFAFDPAVITLIKGEPVEIVVKSLDVAHGLQFRDLGLELQVPKKGTGQLRFTPDKDGDFVGQCAVFCGVGHGEMALTIHVVN